MAAEELSGIIHVILLFFFFFFWSVFVYESERVCVKASVFSAGEWIFTLKDQTFNRRLNRFLTIADP